MRSASRPCSPVHHHEGHAKLAGSPPRASPVRMGPSYMLKKGSQELAPREGGPASPGGALGAGGGNRGPGRLFQARVPQGCAAPS